MLRHSVCPVRKYVTWNMYWHHQRRFSRTRTIFHNSRYFGSKRFSARVIAMRYYVVRNASTFSLFSALVTRWNPHIGTKAPPAILALDHIRSIFWYWHLSSLCIVCILFSYIKSDREKVKIWLAIFWIIQFHLFIFFSKQNFREFSKLLCLKRFDRLFLIHPFIIFSFCIKL